MNYVWPKSLKDVIFLKYVCMYVGIYTIHYNTTYFARIVNEDSIVCRKIQEKRREQRIKK